MKTVTSRESENQMTAVVVKILLILLILFSLPHLVESRKNKKYRKKLDSQIRSTRHHCQTEVCGSYIPEESLNCVFLCVSPSCYETIYGAEPLEDGELDAYRAKRFELCAKEEIRQSRARQRRDAKR